jgi:V/A-type H+-transporting ATPase subunit G/H
VREADEKATATVAEADEKATTLVRDAEARTSSLVREAEEKSAAAVALSDQRAAAAAEREASLRSAHDNLATQFHAAQAAVEAAMSVLKPLDEGAAAEESGDPKTEQLPKPRQN